MFIDTRGRYPHREAQGVDENIQLGIERSITKPMQDSRRAEFIKLRPRITIFEVLVAIYRPTRSVKEKICL